MCVVSGTYGLNRTNGLKGLVPSANVYSSTFREIGEYLSKKTPCSLITYVYFALMTAVYNTVYKKSYHFVLYCTVRVRIT